jgi:hypothetical protein
MLFVRSILLLAVLSVTASAAGIPGTWKAVFTGPLGERPKMVSEIILKLNVEGDRVTGTVHAGNWPGDGPLIDGRRIDGDRITFRFVGASPWRSKSSKGLSSGLPKLTFIGTIQDGEMQITLLWDSVMLQGEPGAIQELPMKATRISD